MAKFLDTQGVSYYLKQLIDGSNDKLYLISPYLQLNNQLKLSLEDRHKFSIDIRIIYGKVSDINPEDSAWLQSMQEGIKLLFHKDLHAKCYFNEKEAIITSMNLYMFSQQNNVEMGIYLSKEHDEDLYKQVATEVDRIKRGSEHRTINVQKVETPIDKKVIKEEPQKETVIPQKSTTFEGKFYSATALSKELGISSKDLTSKFEKLKWIEKKFDETILTNLGKSKGAQMKKGQYGEYIAWPETIIKEII
jgi:phosphatidylserine/phosphatidylglycerophosphate/cardiolipin synthase-like enzyme